MVEAVAGWAAAKATALFIGATGSTSLAAAQAVYAIAYGATYAAAIVGTAYASQALIDTPSADAAQGSIKQPISPRIVAYGRGKLPGFYLLWEARNNYAYDVVSFHHGQVEAIEEVWSHDHILSFVGGGSSGWVAGSPVYGGGNNDLIHLETRLGLPTETAYSALVAALSGDGTWTEDHRGDGIASLGADYRHGKKENLLDDYPNGDPSWSAVGRWKIITDPRDDSTGAFRNTALQILDLLTSDDGMGQDFATTVEPVLDHWLTQIDICDEAIPLAGGGTVPRYESFVYRALSDDPVECLNKLLAACDGRLLMDDEGCWKLWVGKYQEPTVFLTEDDITGYEVAGDASAEDVVNELVPSFKSEEHGWNMVETDPWRDAADSAMRGKVETQALELEAVLNTSQARRLAKREMSRKLTPIRGTLHCKLSAARAMGERWVGVNFPELGFDNVVIEVEEGGVTSLQSAMVSIPFILADENADDWNAATEEGEGPGGGDRLVREALTAPTITDIEVFSDSVGGTDGVRLRVTTTGPDREDLTWAARWRVDGSSSWVEGTFVDIDPTTGVLLETGFVAADALEVQTAYTTGGGAQSPWSATYDVDASVDPPAPTATMPTGLTVELDGADVVVTFSIIDDHGRVFRVASGGGFGSATDVSGEIAATPGVPLVWTDTAPASGFYDYFAVSELADDTASDPAGPAPITVP